MYYFFKKTVDWYKIIPSVDNWKHYSVCNDHKYDSSYVFQVSQIILILLWIFYRRHVILLLLYLYQKYEYENSFMLFLFLPIQIKK